MMRQQYKRASLALCFCRGYWTTHFPKFPMLANLTQGQADIWTSRADFDKKTKDFQTHLIALQVLKRYGQRGDGGIQDCGHGDWSRLQGRATMPIVSNRIALPKSAVYDNRARRLGRASLQWNAADRRQGAGLCGAARRIPFVCSSEEIVDDNDRERYASANRGRAAQSLGFAGSRVSLTLVAAIVGAFVTNGWVSANFKYHVWFGYTVIVLVLFRIVLGFIGTRHAPVLEFHLRPAATLRYVLGLIRGHEIRYAAIIPWRLDGGDAVGGARDTGVLGSIWQ